MFKSTALLVIAVLTFGGANADAQDKTAVRPASPWQLVVSSGSFIPTGAQRADLGRGKVTAAQASYLARPGFAVTASFGWGRTRDVAAPDTPRLHVFTYDLGAELRAVRWLDGRHLSLTPFAGVGAGGRTYDYRGVTADASHNVAGYASAGGEVGVGHLVTVRLEARDYVTRFKPLAGGGTSRARNDLMLVAGLRLGVR
jgi:hypothetical protein